MRCPCVHFQCTTALYIAAEKGYEAVVEKLLKAGAQINAERTDGIKSKRFLVSGACVERYGKRLRQESILHLSHVPIFEVCSDVPNAVWVKNLPEAA